MRDPFEQNVGMDQKGLMSLGGSLAAPSTAYLYDWNLLPIGQMLWEKELMSYKDFPPLQQAASYNLDQILESIKEHGRPGRLIERGNLIANERAVRTGRPLFQFHWSIRYFGRRQCTTRR